MPALFQQAPSAQKEYLFDWSDALEGSTIASASLTTSEGLTAEIVQQDDASVLVSVTGGEHASRHWVRCDIVKAGSGETDSRTMYFHIFQD